MNLRKKKLSAHGATDAVDVIDLKLASITNTRRTVMLGFLVIFLGFGAFVAWSAFAPLDEGVPAQAMVAVDTKRKAIQHMTGGIVERVAVREGQIVKSGQTLVELNDGSARANFESIRQTYMSQRAAEGRLLAEIQGDSSIAFHSDLISASADPVIKQHIITQTRLFEARRSATTNELAAIDETIAGQSAILSGVQLQLENRQVQLQKQHEQLKNISELAEAGFVPRNQALQLEQSQAELKAIIADLNASKVRTERAIAELKLRRSQRMMDFLKESAAQLAEVRREVQAGREHLDATRAELNRVHIKSPVDGQVVGLSIASIGGVVTPGQTLMEIVPSSEAVVLEARIPTHIIDRIHPGDPVTVRFFAFMHTPQLVVDAVITSLSGDAIVDHSQQASLPYYVARISLTSEGIKKLGTRNLQPGMMAEVLIKTGERSLLTYLLYPLTKRISAAMKE